MRLKLYNGPRMADAMAAVRAELGSDAFILSSRKVAGGFEVTAACPRPAAMDTPSDRTARERALRIHGVPAGMVSALLDGSFPQALAGALTFAPTALEAATKPIVFTGLAGSGKTLTLVRLAARMVLAGTRPLIVSADCLKAGANTQLGALLDVLGLDLTMCAPDSLGQFLAKPRQAGPILVDMAGSNPFDAAESSFLTSLFRQNVAHGAVVMPAGMASDEASEMAAAYRGFGAEFLIATRMDVARRFGSVVAAARSGLVLTQAGTGASVIDGLVPMTPDFLAQRLLELPAGRNIDDSF